MNTVLKFIYAAGELSWIYMLFLMGEYLIKKFKTDELSIRYQWKPLGLTIAILVIMFLSAMNFKNWNNMNFILKSLCIIGYIIWFLMIFVVYEFILQKLFKIDNTTNNKAKIEAAVCTLIIIFLMFFSAINFWRWP